LGPENITKEVTDKSGKSAILLTKRNFWKCYIY